LDLNLDDSFLSPSDLIKKLQGIDFAFTVKEIADESNMFNISIRSHNEEFSSLGLAKMLNPNSGGHIMAAGANVKANSTQDAIRIVIDTATKIRSQDNS
jgi:nanoRNase/pAp phosphatase (c-di-AMP/oligoRNAs hydrolase)